MVWIVFLDAGNRNLDRDRTPDGHGWLIDPTPMSDSEFARTTPFAVQAGSHPDTFRGARLWSGRWLATCKCKKRQVANLWGPTASILGHGNGQSR